MGSGHIVGRRRTRTPHPRDRRRRHDDGGVHQGGFHRLTRGRHPLRGYPAAAVASGAKTWLPRGSQQGQTFLSTVPSVAMRSGNFSELNRVIYDPQTGQPFAGNIIPSDRIDSVARTGIP